MLIIFLPALPILAPPRNILTPFMDNVGCAGLIKYVVPLLKFVASSRYQRQSNEIDFYGAEPCKNWFPP